MSETIEPEKSGPLRGLRVVEFAGIGPAPFCGMLLADHGADVVRIERPGAGLNNATPILNRGKCRVSLDLKDAASRDRCLDLLAAGEVLIEGFRPGVMEGLGLGPDVVMALNPAMVYARMTGWGQDGEFANIAGHDINYIALSGALASIGTDSRPVPPLNLVGDFGGGALYLAFGILAGILHARHIGKGQVIDCAMTDGVASLMTMIYGMRTDGMWLEGRRNNLLDGGAPFYDVYETADGKFVAFGALEPQFFQVLVDRLELGDFSAADQYDREKWPRLRQAMTERVRRKSRDEWDEIFAGSDACYAPVLTMDEAPEHPHNKSRGTFIKAGGKLQPAPAPRFAQTPGRPGPIEGLTEIEQVIGRWR